MIVWGWGELVIGSVGSLEVLDVDGVYKPARVQVLGPATKDEYLEYCRSMGGTITEGEIDQPGVLFWRVSHD